MKKTLVLYKLNSTSNNNYECCTVTKHRNFEDFVKQSSLKYNINSCNIIKYPIPTTMSFYYFGGGDNKLFRI